MMEILKKRADLMFTTTQCGMRFYKELFGKAYPFRKYDQIFVPEFNAGAMENFGCVTFREDFLYKNEDPTLAKILTFSTVNLHELAHMWFGDLVTMKWWNDLWLNEAFATFMSILSMDNIKEISEMHPTCWVEFNRYCMWGANTDQMSSTHAIQSEVANTEEAEMMFDGISYGKGSAWLKQFYKMVGYDVMKKGLHVYFEKHKFSNTTLPDFVGAIADAYEQSPDKTLGQDFSLQKWCDEWLTSSGINIIEPIVDGNKISIKQTMALRGKNRLRKQRLDIALYDQDGKLHVIKDHFLSEINEMTEVDMSSVPADFKFAAVYINHGNHGYAKVRFDQNSVQWFTDNLSTKVDSAPTRSSIWEYFRFLVLDK